MSDSSFEDRLAVNRATMDGLRVIFAELESRGVRLSIDRDGELAIDDPHGRLTADERDEMRQKRQFWTMACALHYGGKTLGEIIAGSGSN